MDKKIIFILLGNMMLAFSVVLIVPVVYVLLEMRLLSTIIFFAALTISVAALGVIFLRIGRNHRRRLPAVESAAAMFFIYVLIAAVGAVPIIFTGWLPPIDAMLESFSDVTAAGLSLLPKDVPYIFRLWQSLLMWFGSLIFLVLLVTLMPEVGGCFGIYLSLHGGQNFSPIFGQMNSIARRVIKVYIVLTAISVGLFKLAGLNFWDSFLMAMRCISTGGGDFFPGRGNIYVEYAAVATMLAACGNFLFYHRLIQTIPPPKNNSKENFFRRGMSYVKRLGKNIVYNVGHFYRNSEVKAVTLIIFLGVGFIFISTFRRGLITDGNDAFRYAIFHVVSFLSTTGINLAAIDAAHDFDRFLVFLMAIFGGCMGSVTGGLKIIRVLILWKITAAELQRTMHPHMVTSIRVNNLAVPPKIVGRILAFFFLACITLFICAAVLSFVGPKFSEAVAMSVTCLTNVGTLPGICGAENFLALPPFGKIFCALILVVGRLEIFALLVFVAGLKSRDNFGKW